MAAKVKTMTDEEQHALYHLAQEDLDECVKQKTDEKIAMLFHESDSDGEGCDHSEIMARLNKEASLVNQAAFMAFDNFKEEVGEKDFLEHATYMSFLAEAVIAKLGASEKRVVSSKISGEETLFTEDPSSSPILCSNPDCKGPKVTRVNSSFSCDMCGISYCSDDCKDYDHLPHRFRVCDASNGGPSCFHRRLNKQAAAPK